MPQRYTYKSLCVSQIYFEVEDEEEDKEKYEKDVLIAAPVPANSAKARGTLYSCVPPVCRSLLLSHILSLPFRRLSFLMVDTQDVV